MPFIKNFLSEKGKHFPNLLYASNKNFRTGGIKNEK